MGISYGYCGTPSVNWKVKYSPMDVGSCADGKGCVTLVKTVKEVVPNWYASAHGELYEQIRGWMELLKCDQQGMPRSVSLDMQLDEVYRWRPKDSPVTKGQVVNYNFPCSGVQKGRKISRVNMDVSLSGVGVVDRARFEWTMVNATEILATLGRIDLDDGDFRMPDWHTESCARERPIGDWHTYTVSTRGTSGAPDTLPPWSALSVSLNDISSPVTSSLVITTVSNYTDKDSRTVDFQTVLDQLKTAAGITDC